MIALGDAVEVDRCLVRLVDGGSIGPVVEQWSRPGDSPIDNTVTLPETLESLCLAAAEHDSLRIDDIFDDPRLATHDAREIQDTLGICSYLGAPMWAGEQLIGWLVMHTVGESRAWSPRQLTIIHGVARDLGTALLQAHAYQQKEQAVLVLERADRLKNELVSNVSHELRTPLSSIIGYLELLRAGELGDLNEQQRRVLTTVSRNADRLALLIEDLLLLARTDAEPAAHPAPQPVALNRLIDDVRRTVVPLAESGRIDLEVGGVPPAAAVLGRADDLERILFNLLSNAIKFTPRGGTVRIESEATSTTVTITVEDTGHGIDADDIPRLFDRFYRTTDASERAIQGTGLGLAVVKSLVDQHHGQIDIVSTPGCGTTVTLTLPRAAAPPAAARSAETPSTGADSRA